jgi:hypothetical protein
MLAALATMVVLAAGATTLPATDVTNTSATLNGSLEGATEAHFQYGTTTDYGSRIDVEAADGPVSAPVTDLSPNTTYHFKLFSDAGDGDDVKFTTAPNPKPPAVGNQRATKITTTSAHLSATLNPNGAATTYYFQYGRTTRYGHRTSAVTVPAGTQPVAVQADLSGLRPYTRYHWRLNASNSAGRGLGPDRAFPTARLATAVTLYTAAKVVQWGHGVMLGGRVTGAGVRGMTLTLERQQFPYDGAFAQVRTTRADEDGGYLFSIDNVWAATRFRVVSQTQDPRASAVVTVNARPRARIAGRLLNRARARISGTIAPAITGELSLQRRTASRWVQVRQRALVDSKKYSFKVWRARKVTRAYRVVVLPARGAYAKATSRKVFVSPRPGRARGHRAAAG